MVRPWCLTITVVAACLVLVTNAHKSNSPPCPISIPSKNSASTRKGSVAPKKPSRHPFSIFNGTGDTEERNEDHIPEIPIGPLRGNLSPSVKHFQPQQYYQNISRRDAGNPVVFAVDTAFGDKVASGLDGFVPPDMSGAQHDKVVLTSGNVFAALSINGGETFTYLNPSIIFDNRPVANVHDGLCCDQVIQYVPKIDRFVWLMQFKGTLSAITGDNMLRIASASPADIIRDFNLGNYLATGKQTSWTYWDLTSASLSLGSFSMDYPDMSVGTNFLYFSVDLVRDMPLGGLLVVRIPLSEIRDRKTIHFQYTNPSVSRNAYGAHLSQNTGDTVFWAGHSSTSQLQVFSFPENSNRYFWQFVNIGSWCGEANADKITCGGDYSSTCPGSKIDWLGKLSSFPRSAVIGTTRRFPKNKPPEVWFAWAAPRVGNFHHPHIQVVKINTGGGVYSVIEQFQIWNPDFAFAYPYLSTNANQEVGISLGWGGNKFYANHAVGILGDFVVWYSELSDKCAVGDGVGRWGDYVTVRQASPRSKLYAATGYSVRKNPPPGSGQFNPRYILFGRKSDV